MTEKHRLLENLFSKSDREHVNIKFFRSYTAVAPISVEEFCETVNNALLQVDSGLVKPTARFSEVSGSVDVSTLKACAAA